MKKIYLSFVLLFNLNLIIAQPTYIYPPALKDSSRVDKYFETTIRDPYQWMEDPSDPRLIEWLELQKKISKNIGSKKTKFTSIRKEVSKLYWDIYEYQSDDYTAYKNLKKSKYEFDYKTTRFDRFPNLRYKIRDQDFYKLLVKSKRYKYDEIDNVTITNRYINEIEDLAAIALSHSGSDWREIFFFDLKTGDQLQDTLKHLRNGSNLIWHGRNAYYDNYEKPKKGRELLDNIKGQKLHYHKLGTPQSEDSLLFQNPDTTGAYRFKYIKRHNKFFFDHFIKVANKNYHAFSVTDINLESFHIKNFLIYPDTDSIQMQIVGLKGDSILLKTNWDAPNERVIMTDITQVNNLIEFIPEYDASLRNIRSLGKDMIAGTYRKSGKYFVLIYNWNGELLRKIDFPEGKKVNHFYDNRINAKRTNFSISSFYHPELWYQLSFEDLTFKPARTISLPHEQQYLETKYLNYESKDGKLIPMYITCLNNIKLDGTNPTLLYGYGGYGITIEPQFDYANLLWLLRGGVIAIPNIRGGGAKNSQWALEGRRLKKQNAIDDFIAASEYLIREKYTSPNRLAIKGGSHGGMLVGAAITQRPELYKAAIAVAGIYDMLRFEKYTIGSADVSLKEFGSTSDSLDFKNLKSYSPLHNVKKDVTYPNLLMITGDSDDRVPPFHTYKFLASLQENGNPKSLYHLYVVPGAGHSGAKNTKDYIDQKYFELYFLYNQLGLKYK